MDKIKRKSQKKKRVIVSSKKIDNLFMLFFELENTDIKFCVGCSNLNLLNSPFIISDKIASILKSNNQNFVYCLETDIEKEFKKWREKND